MLPDTDTASCNRPDVDSDDTCVSTYECAVHARDAGSRTEEEKLNAFACDVSVVLCDIA